MRGDAARPSPAYRLFDEQGDVLVLRSDMTIPIARVVGDALRRPPSRRCASATSRTPTAPVRPAARPAARDAAGRDRADRRAGAGGHGRGADRAVRGARRRRACSATGSGSATPACTRRCSTRFGVGRGRARPAAARARHARLRRPRARGRARSGCPTSRPSCCCACRRLRGGPEVLEAAGGPATAAVDGLRARASRCSRRAVAERVIFDLGLIRSLGYYTGAVFEVYDPALGAPLGGGGRYDDLLGRFGRPLPAVGFALNVERLHIALAGEERARSAAPTASPSPSRAARSSATRSTCSTRSASTPPRCAPTTASCCSPTSASSRCAPPTCPPTSRRAPPTSASPARTCSWSSPSARLRAARPGLRALRDGPRDGRRRAGPGRARRCGASASCGSPRSTRASPRAASSSTGRQAEIVEVKGSVELAPLTGLVEGIVDLTATGTTLRENGLVMREEIAVCTARLIANPRRPQAQGRRRSTTSWSGCVRPERFEVGGDPAGVAAPGPRPGPGAEVGRGARGGDHRAGARGGRRGAR